MVKPEVTLKPLTRGRYRCNQTGVVLKKGRVASYRHSRLAEMGFGRKPIKVQEPKKMITVPTKNTVPNWKGDVSCPHCGHFYWNEPNPGEKICRRCNDKFVVLDYDMAKLSAPLEVEVSSWSGRIECPCGRRNEPPGEGIAFNCSRCERPLKQKPKTPPKPPVVRIEHRGSLGYWAFCPHCRKLNRGTEIGLNTCEQCRNEFEVSF